MGNRPHSDSGRRRLRPWQHDVLQGILLGLATMLVLALLSVLAAIGVYAYYAPRLPVPGDLYERASAFRSLKIYDRDGALLWETFAPEAGRRTVVAYEDLPRDLINATIATEDKTFFSNQGVSAFAIARATIQDLQAGEIVSGASTITQQLVKQLYLSTEQSLSRKLKEVILAIEITRRYSKKEILALYLNEVYLGNHAYGIGSAAETYFGKHVSGLSLAESALLVGLIQSPTAYDPYQYPEAALARRATVLDLMIEEGYITPDQAAEAKAAPLDLSPRGFHLLAPHMVMHVLGELEETYPSEELYNRGLLVYTTLDLDLQHQAEATIAEKMPALRERGASNAALVAMDPMTGDILAMVGSADYQDPQIAGNVNVATSPRQPGSTIKPFLYLAAMEHGWTASTMVMDVYQEFPPSYQPVNHDDKEWGPISVRTALACSRNVPAVSTLQQIGMPAFLDVARRVGLTSYTADSYGLSMALGAYELTLLELTGAYGALANGGYHVEPRAILRIETQDGEVILDSGEPRRQQAVDPRLAYIVTDILSDEQERARAFGYDSNLNLPFPAGAKTGTTNDYRDSWLVGYTPELVTGVWVGNHDGRPMDELTGSRGAGSIWRPFMERALAEEAHGAFSRPPGLVEVEVCPVSGLLPGPNCPGPVTELFLEENVPQLECPVHIRERICTVSGDLASEHCPESLTEQRSFVDLGPSWDAWAREQELEPPPRETCSLHDRPTVVRLDAWNGPISGVVSVRGTADMPNFAYYRLDYGIGNAPESWRRLTPEIGAVVRDGVLARWDTRTLNNGIYSLRLVVRSHDGYEEQAVVAVHIQNATPTPTASPTPFPTPTQPSARDDGLRRSLTPVPTPTELGIDE
ncbi:MAG: penicillin-binding protein 1C [Anaerolineae bacterium]